jgi:type IV pilus assembly protein PilO
MPLIPSDPRQQKRMMVGVLAVALGAVYHTMLAAPKTIELDAVQARVDSLEAANAKASAASRGGTTTKIRAEAAAYRRDLDVLRQLVPTGNEVPALLEQVSTAARRAGLDIAAVQPQPVVVGETFDTYRYKITIAGAYHPLGEFLTNVGSLTRIIAPVNLQLDPIAGLSPAAMRRMPPNSAPLKATFEIQTYVAKGSATPPPVVGERVAAVVDTAPAPRGRT